MSVLLKELSGEGVLTLTLNRPKARNAIDAELRARLQEAFEAASADAAVRALVLTGAAGHFCAGGDLSSMQNLSPEAARERLADVSRTALTIAACEKPVIAAVEGHAAGAGVGLALLCDRVIAGPGAVFTLSFAKVGLAPDWGLTLTLPQRVGRAEARRLAWEAGRLEAAEALAKGLADELAEEGALDRARAFATRLAEGPASAIAAIKEHFRQSSGLLAEALEREARAQLACFASPEFAEGLAAFSEKRRPDFHKIKT
jgi:2-(1,2-epoxy-1,2-dihydrophenyl)acetyl-CoA isomerase